MALTVASTGVYGGAMSGLGGLRVQGARLQLDGASTNAGETVIGTGGTLAFGAGGSIASSGTITVSDAGSSNAR